MILFLAIIFTIRPRFMRLESGRLVSAAQFPNPRFSSFTRYIYGVFIYLFVSIAENVST